MNTLNISSLGMLLLALDELDGLAGNNVVPGLAELASEHRLRSKSSAGTDALDSESLAHDGAAASDNLEVAHCASTNGLSGRGGKGAKGARRRFLEEGAQGARLLQDGLHCVGVL